MKINNIIVLLTILTLLHSCGSGSWHIAELYAQKIEGTSKILYKYDAWGGRDSHAAGFLILDSTDNFKINIENELPINYLSNIPNKLNIQGIKTECYNTCGENYYKSTPVYKPMKIVNTKSTEINIETITYQYRGFSEKSNGLETYQFENFIETKDSLFFFNLEDIQSLNGIKLKELRLKKGAVYLHKNNNDYVQKIVIENQRINNITKNYIEGHTYFLKPKHKILIAEFSDRGIFKDILVHKY